tara:strand:- start:79 stop:516 length:438 start_codon:yes stop_codon:yes gene_type:complete
MGRLLKNAFEEYFSNIHTTLDICLTNSPISVSLSPIQIYDDDDEVFFDLTPDELNEVCYKHDKITLVVEYMLPTKEKKAEKAETQATYRNKNGFTVKEMLDIVKDFEKNTRPLYEWFGEIDRSHVFFEGFKKKNNETTYTIFWGS